MIRLREFIVIKRNIKTYIIRSEGLDTNVPDEYQIKHNAVYRVQYYITHAFNGISINSVPIYQIKLQFFPKPRQK